MNQTGHIKRRHEDSNLHRTFVCSQCEKGFFSAFDLKQHILTHSDVKRFTCPACGKLLKNDSCYRRHMVCVHGLKFTCEICNKDFSAQNGLNIHKRDVHGIRTHQETDLASSQSLPRYDSVTSVTNTPREMMPI